MAAKPARNQGRYHAGLTAETIVDAALALSECNGLLSWSLRDLAGALEVAPSVIYHHVGGKDVLARSVVERVVTTTFVNPDPALPWQDWFRGLLFPARAHLRRYPGVAKWLLMHGPSFPGIAPVIDGGTSVLLRAGFGERTPLVYAAIVNTALLTASMTDDRLAHEGDGPRDHAAMMADFAKLADQSPGIALIASGAVAPFAADEDTAERMRDHYYRFVVDAIMDGVQKLITEGRAP